MESGDRAERYSRLPIYSSASPQGKRVLLSQRMELTEGEVLLGVAEFQVTNDRRVNVYVGSQIVLATDPTGTVGRGLTPPGGGNVTPDMHHGQQTKLGLYRVRTADAGLRYVNLVVWAASSRASEGDELTVDRGYGRLSVTDV